jgi:hypothetical protein
MPSIFVDKQQTGIPDLLLVIGIVFPIRLSVNLTGLDEGKKMKVSGLLN